MAFLQSLHQQAQEMRLAPPIVEKIDRTGPDHAPSFRCTLFFDGERATSDWCTSQAEAKNQAARNIVLALKWRAERKVKVQTTLPMPAPPIAPPASIFAPPASVFDEPRYISRLFELCQQYHLPAPRFDAVSSGPGNSLLWKSTLRIHGEVVSQGDLRKTKKEADSHASELGLQIIERALLAWRASLDWSSEALLRYIRDEARKTGAAHQEATAPKPPAPAFATDVAAEPVSVASDEVGATQAQAAPRPRAAGPREDPKEIAYTTTAPVPHARPPPSYAPQPPLKTLHCEIVRATAEQLLKQAAPHSVIFAFVTDAELASRIYASVSGSEAWFLGFVCEDAPGVSFPSVRVSCAPYAAQSRDALVRLEAAFAMGVMLWLMLYAPVLPPSTEIEFRTIGALASSDCATKNHFPALLAGQYPNLRFASY